MQKATSESASPEQDRQTEAVCDRRPPPRMWLGDPRFRVVVLLGLLLIVTFTVQRAIVLTATWNRFEQVSGAEIFQSFLVGLRYDVVVCCMLLLPLIPLSLTIACLLRQRWFQNVVAGYCALVLALVFFTCVVDGFFFEEIGERLNHKVIDYLEYEYIYTIIWHEYPVIPVMIVTAAILLLAHRLVRRLGFGRRHDKADPDAAGKRPRTPLWAAICWPAVLVPLLVLGIRGSIGPKALNTGPAYFSSSMPLAQLTLNGLFTLREAVVSAAVRHRNLADHLELLGEEEALAKAVELLARPEDRFCNDPDNPLRRITDTGRPRKDYNVVVVVLESLSWPYVGPMGGDERLTPTLNALMVEGVLMDRCFAVGGRTTRGFSGVIGGFPDLPGKSVTTRIEAEGNFLTLCSVLAPRGYDTVFIYAGQPYYDHRQSFLGSNGCSRFVFSDKFRTRTFRSHLGWCDQDLFDQAHREFAAADKPFCAILLTLTFHKDYDIPAGKIQPVEAGHRYARQLDAIRYTDWALGRFMEKARKAEYFDRTIFVFVADHKGGFKERPSTLASYRIPFLIYAPAILPARRVSTVCSQTDVPPTIMSLLGGSYEHCFFGSSVLDRPKEAGRALIQDKSFLALMDANEEALLVPFGAAPTLFKYTAPNGLAEQTATDPATQARRDQMRRQATALLQSAYILFQRGAYNLRKSPAPE